MLHKCANPNCINPFRRLSEGKLFLLETEAGDPSNAGQAWATRGPRRIEHFWLCDQCASVLTLAFKKGRGMVTVPLPEATRKKPVVPVRFREVADDAIC